ncbi:hypothetical protein AAU61_11470 [Desulfocarbo indianensis]|nr:hypothetical protein AAU61_11470 [Desulfocarbo indianensis]
MKKFLTALALALCCAALLVGTAPAKDNPAKADAKSPAPAKAEPLDPARVKAAEEYWKAAQIAEMIQDSMNRMSMRIPENERDKFKEEISSKLMGSGRIKKETVETAARTFTSQELDALSKFYASPEGRSSMEKMPAFMAQLSRIVQAELVGLMEKARAEQMKKEEAEKAKQDKAAPKDKAPAKAPDAKKAK